MLSDAEIEEVLEHIDDLVKWASEVKEYATKVTLESDKEWTNFKLVEGKQTLVPKSDKRKEIVIHDVNKKFKVTEEK